MDQSKITVRYSKAILDLAKEKKQLDTLREDIELIYTLCHENTNFIALLESPTIRASQKIKLLKSLFNKKIDPITLKFLELVINNNRETWLPAICRYLLSLYRQEEGIKSARFTSAVNLNPKLISDIREQLEEQLKASVELTPKVNPSLIGGFVLRIDDLQIDASISSQLKKAKKVLLQSEIK
ncbi:MAG: ATP synthase F1 subunit delta [Anaerorhabdus sp.]|uniref:ATP synthase F1 subunit delta n=1 Tax=Anaerorhabdus sp. TaxID=1872524 RepID=UPI003A85C58E